MQTTIIHCKDILWPIKALFIHALDMINIEGPNQVFNYLVGLAGYFADFRKLLCLKLLLNRSVTSCTLWEYSPYKDTTQAPSPPNCQVGDGVNFDKNISWQPKRILNGPFRQIWCFIYYLPYTEGCLKMLNGLKNRVSGGDYVATLYSEYAPPPH